MSWNGQRTTISCINQLIKKMTERKPLLQTSPSSASFSTSACVSTSKFFAFRPPLARLLLRAASMFSSSAPLFKLVPLAACSAASALFLLLSRSGSTNPYGIIVASICGAASTALYPQAHATIPRCLCLAASTSATLSHALLRGQKFSVLQSAGSSGSANRFSGAATVVPTFLPSYRCLNSLAKDEICISKQFSLGRGIIMFYSQPVKC